MDSNYIFQRGRWYRTPRETDWEEAFQPEEGDSKMPLQWYYVRRKRRASNINREKTLKSLWNRGDNRGNPESSPCGDLKSNAEKKTKRRN